MIRDTAAAVFRDRAYGRPTLLQRLGRWFLDRLAALFNSSDLPVLPPAVFWILVSVLVLVLLGVTAVVIYRLQAARDQRRTLNEASGRGRLRNYWSEAQAFAAAGDYTSAAHALYGALLRAIAQTGELQLDDAKTIGEYTRELAMRSSTRLPRFREFARGYETVIYGLGFCDRERFERLQLLATQTARLHG